MWLLIEPQDVVMFRDGRPFNAGENSAAATLFPPSAFSVQGALRALYLDQSGLSWDQALSDAAIKSVIGTGDTLGTFGLKGPYLVRKHDGIYERLFPFPADLVRERDRTRDPWRALRPSNQPASIHSDLKHPLHLLDISPDEEAPSDMLWLTEDTFVSYLENAYVSPHSVIPQDDLLAYEFRTGIAIDYAPRVVEEGKLYSASFVRLQPDVAFAVWIADDLPLAPLFANDQRYPIRFGGEGRTAQISALATESVVHHEYRVPSPDSSFKIVFLTNTYIAGEYIPTTLSDDNREALVSVCYRKPLAIGGWDLSRRRPRTSYRYLPAGSVMYFGKTARLQSPLVDQPARDCLPLEPLGFGEFAYGSWGDS